MSIRTFERDDFENLVIFFEDISREPLRFGLRYDRTRLEKLTTNLERDHILLAFDGTYLSGVAAVFGSSLPEDRGVAHFIVYIRQGYQNQGLGTYLTRLILQEAKRKGYHKVLLEVVAENIAGIKAYEKAGFLVEGRTKDSHFGPDGSYHDIVIMGIIL